MIRSFSQRRVVVTGAAGFLGSHLCERLVELGARVVGVDDAGHWLHHDRLPEFLRIIGEFVANPRASA